MVSDTADAQKDHRTFVRSMPPAQRANLTRKSNRHGLVHAAVHFGLILALGGLIATRVPYWPVLLLPQGVLIVFLFTLLHECSHKTVFATGRLNAAVAFLCGLAFALPPEWFRYFHYDHHRYTQDPARDPELATPKPATLLEYLIHVTGLPVYVSQIKTLVRNAAGGCDDPYIPDRARTTVRREAQAMLIVYGLAIAASVSVGTTALLWAWIVPALLGQPFLRLYLLAEHGGCPNTANMLENTRTVFTNWPVRKLAWNMPYHIEHHTLPGVPFHKLPELHALMRDRLLVTEPGYLRFHRKLVAGLSR